MPGKEYLDELREAGLMDFRVFLAQLWAFLQLPRPTKVQNDMALWLQNPGTDRIVLSAFRGVGKSWITVAFVLWKFLLDPETKVLVVSASQQLSDNFTKFCLQIISQMPLLQHLYPSKGWQRKSSVSFDVGPARPSRDPSLRAASITGQLSGSRADIVVLDDVEIPGNSFTHHLRNKLSEAVKEVDAILKPGGTVIYLGTPQVEESLYLALTQRGYKMLVWPAEIPESPQNYGGPLDSPGNRLAPFVKKRIKAGWAPHTPLEAIRFPTEELMKRKLSYGRAGYGMQFMLDVSLQSIEKNPLHVSDLIIYDTHDTLAPTQIMWTKANSRTIQDLQSGGHAGDFFQEPRWVSEDMVPYQGTVMAIDPSGQGKDETAYAIVSLCNGNLYVREVGGFIDGFGEKTLRALADATKRHNVDTIIDEPNYGGGMFRQVLTPVIREYGMGSFDEEYSGWARGMKELRILDTLTPVMRSHRLIVDRRVIQEDLKQQEKDQYYSFVWQMTRMEHVRGALPHEDRLEAVSMAVAYWIDSMSQDQKVAASEHKTRLKLDELKRFAKHVYGGRPNQRPTRNRRYRL